jgi:hypothetical protein
MATLYAALASAGAGQGQVAALVGEPGVGKSRLVWELTHSHRTARIGVGCSPTWPDPFFNRLRALCVIRRSVWAAPPSRPSEMVVTL